MKPITFRDLKALVGSTRGLALPTAKVLRESGEMALEAMVGAGIRLRVYRSGFYTYETSAGTTVYAVDRCAGYEYENGDYLASQWFEEEDWVVRLALSAEDRLERNQRRKEEEGRFSYSGDAAEGKDLWGPQDFTATLESREQVEGMLAILTEKQRQAIQLCILQQLPQMEAARQLGISQPMVAKHLSAAIARLKKENLKSFEGRL
ncbi:MAG: sigma-70 family RNA polymerase sigma factor [Candidatus Limiplasma sp.]|nr:sigma-70 family RNA polymerase sigma factor [Candidatus Limiplasma sp.]